MQKPFQQLDLFGMPIEPAPVKKKPVVKEKAAETIVPVVQESQPVYEPAPVTSIESAPKVEEAVAPKNDPVVFADERIVVKIKAKPAPSPVAEEVKPTEQVSVVETSKSLPSKRGRKSFREIDTEVDLVEIPDEETLSQKLYYPISEVAGWFKVNTSLLRYWENEFDILQPRKTRKGDRLFRVDDIKNLQLIYFLLRQRKFSIEGARNYLKQNKGQADVQLQLVQSLTRFKSFLLELKAGLNN